MSSSAAGIAQTTIETSPIINAHLHATFERNTTLASVLDEMNENHVQVAVLSGADKELALKWQEAAPGRFLVGASFPCTDGIYPRIYPCFAESNGWPDLEWLKEQFASGNMHVMGELLYVYYGIPPTDERLQPYFALAAEMAIPVGVHAADGPPVRGRPKGCCPNFRAEFGDPLLLKPVLEKHPTLKIWLIHAGEVRFHQQAVALMREFPNVYADMSILNSVMPVDLHQNLLESFLNAGLEDRIMLGTDNMPVKDIVERLERFEFLSNEQRRKIMFDNAARFFDIEPTSAMPSTPTY
ncbi:amidohydrolase family protein [Pseudidiomarina sp. CB1]|uniref:amidohydrolase family protein n=1 Tax=Pseudidiomarina sp. CB1 TaxID=2972484 RepID=UPI0021638BDE|nr:amidohydrolase family protein [Pseudidiomarina sp. CB1]